MRFLFLLFLPAIGYSQRPTVDALPELARNLDSAYFTHHLNGFTYRGGYFYADSLSTRYVRSAISLRTTDVVYYTPDRTLFNEWVGALQAQYRFVKKYQLPSGTAGFFEGDGLAVAVLELQTPNGLTYQVRARKGSVDDYFSEILR